MSAVIDRPEIGYDDAAHAYTVDGRPVPGVSTIAKIGSDSFTPAAWWGWGLAVDGLFDIFDGTALGDADALRVALKEAGHTPNAKRDAAAGRGNSVHDALEKLAQDGDIPDPSRYPEEERGHVRSLIRWHLHYRPSYVATEVMVGSREHGFAGRYDVRASIGARRLGFKGASPDPDPRRLCLVDLKTSKATYPETHFVQLEGYELASVEMGFPPTDGGRWLLRTRADGEFVPHDAVPAHRWDESSFVRSWATADDFLGYLAAFNARTRVQDADPLRLWRAEIDAWLLGVLASGAHLARDLAAVPIAHMVYGLDSRAIGMRLGRLRKRGEVRQLPNKAWCLA